MSFLRVVSLDPLPILRSERLVLRVPALADHPEWASLRERSREYLEPWEPLWPDDDLSRPAFRRRIKRYLNEIHEGSTYPFLVFDGRNRQMLGGITLAQVRRGVTQTGTIGYWMGMPHAGRGHMTEAVAMVAGFAFDTLKLHRLEAACLPSNAASIRLLEKVGFSREGLARSYLCIAGAWRDHLLWGLVAGDPLSDGRRDPREARGR
ncbi:N-acetyltransferase [Siculibacillus lacustris]|uniref:N-acetyltransferase n=1 Tax=Siculibacillus lacustris TaxID=1549641 RepID=A0A4Q9VIB4_9HYPH|nr:GNAT family protein [Siculibacillus lacustris]TBW34968.1 N-acetyltransferase [Siculibacillus lacustris]